MFLCANIMQPQKYKRFTWFLLLRLPAYNPTKAQNESKSQGKTPHFGSRQQNLCTKYSVLRNFVPPSFCSGLQRSLRSVHARNKRAQANKEKSKKKTWEAIHKKKMIDHDWPRARQRGESGRPQTPAKQRHLLRQQGGVAAQPPPASSDKGQNAKSLEKRKTTKSVETVCGHFSAHTSMKKENRKKVNECPTKKNTIS